MKIAVYGGSFNPPHLGHIEAAKTVVRELNPDKLIIIPDNIPPHKELADNSPSPDERMELCRLAFGDIPGAEISDIEINREGKSYTADTVDELKELYPDSDFYLVIGTDMLTSFEEWYRFEHLLSACTLTVLSREEDDSAKIREAAQKLKADYKGNIIILSHQPLVMSSSEIREKLRSRLGSELLKDEVYSCIIKNNFYDALPELSWLREKVYEYLDSKRVAHVMGCESEAVQLARTWGEDEETAATAAILHDITKNLSYEEHLAMCLKYSVHCDPKLLAEPKLLHAVTGAAFSRDLFGISDDIYNAIRWHTTGKPDMTLLEKIIYLADYIEPTRDFDGVEKLRELAYRDIDKAMAAGLEMSISDIRRKGQEPYIDSLEACVYYNTEGED